jgi:hypothetical protein
VPLQIASGRPGWGVWLWLLALVGFAGLWGVGYGFGWRHFGVCGWEFGGVGKQPLAMSLTIGYVVGAVFSWASVCGWWSGLGLCCVS